MATCDPPAWTEIPPGTSESSFRWLRLLLWQSSRWLLSCWVIQDNPPAPPPAPAPPESLSENKPTRSPSSPLPYSPLLVPAPDTSWTTPVTFTVLQITHLLYARWWKNGRSNKCKFSTSPFFSWDSWGSVPRLVLPRVRDMLAFHRPGTF